MGPDAGSEKGAGCVEHTIARLSSTRDLRAAILEVALACAESGTCRTLMLADPAISDMAAKREWQSALSVLDPSVRDRLSLRIDRTRAAGRGSLPRERASYLPLKRPNYRYEVLRLLAEADLTGEGDIPVSCLVSRLGASQTATRAAIRALMAAGVVQGWGGYYGVRVEDLLPSVLAQVEALPQQLRFRLARDTSHEAIARILDKASLLLGPEGPPGGRSFAVSGLAAASCDVPELNRGDIHRLDLVVRVPRSAKVFNQELMQVLHSLGDLEQETNVASSAPVVVTLVRGERFTIRPGGRWSRRAGPADVLLSLMDFHQHESFLSYAHAMKGRRHAG